MKKSLMTATAMAVSVFALQASAITISYSVDGWGPVTLANVGQPGDTIELLAYSDPAFGLVAETPVTAKINTLLFGVNYTEPSGQFPLTFSRSMTIQLVTGNISQTGIFDSWYTYYPNDAIWLFYGPTVTFDLGADGRVDVTPLAASILNVNQNSSVDINATFVWHTPDGGATLALLGLALTGLAGLRRKLSA